MNLPTAAQLRDAGCTCEFGCMNCQMPEAMMGSCSAWAPCPVGRAPDPACPLTENDHARPQLSASSGRGE
jgi:hypothetical protein